jgi:hypothetical protein
MTNKDRWLEYARLARIAATEKPWAANSLRQTAEYWTAAARLGRLPNDSDLGGL